MATGSVIMLADAPTWTGSLPTWLILVGGLFVMWRLTRGGGGSAVTELSKSNEVLSEALERQKKIADDQAKQIAALESKTDVVLAVTPLIATHEQKAQERHDATIEVLHEMSRKLGA